MVPAALGPPECPAAVLACWEQSAWPANQRSRALLCSRGRPQGAGSALVLTASANQRRILPQQGQHAQVSREPAPPAPPPPCCQGQADRALPCAPCSARASEPWGSRSCTAARRPCSRNAQWLEALHGPVQRGRVPRDEQTLLRKSHWHWQLFFPIPLGTVAGARAGAQEGES